MAFHDGLLAWYDRAKRDLPWRQTRDPYAIWVSEVMLQQTQVDTVIPYWHRFLAEFPDVTRLAQAPSDRLMKAWEGLGYYSRARNLQKAAHLIVARHGGQLPASLAELRDLPGFGPYTTAAVGSIAFGIPAAAVDGTVMRVITRLRGWQDDVARPQTRQKIERDVEALIPALRAGDFTQALMELGATVCTPKKPRCPVCPVRDDCLTQGDALPIKGKTSRVKSETLRVAVVLNGDRVLLYRRPAEGLWAGLWDFPQVEQVAGMSLTWQGELATFDRLLTHRRLTFSVALYRGAGAPPLGEWVETLRLREFPLSKGGQRIVSELERRVLHER